MKHLKFFAALCCTAVLFAACDKNDEPKNDDSKDGGKESYTLTVLSNDESLGTVTGSGKYESGTTVKITAKPADEAEFVSWSDVSSVELEREIVLTSDSTIKAIFSLPAVDLGLSVKWASCNLGASKPEEYGNHYAWGETTTSDAYGWGYYSLRGSDGVFLKYAEDGLTTLEAVDDAATANWGEPWRMPTEKEWNELIDGCSREWTTDYNGTGVTGRIFTSKVNGNSIFIPSAGYCEGNNNTYTNYGKIGYYWSNTLSNGNWKQAIGVQSWKTNAAATGYERYLGYSIRAVRK